MDTFNSNVRKSWEDEAYRALAEWATYFHERFWMYRRPLWRNLLGRAGSRQGTWRALPDGFLAYQYASL